MQETYSGSSRRIRLSSREIRKMKENMKKVPEIQKKSDAYHRLESQEADKILNSISEAPPEEKKEQQESSKKSLREKIKLLFNKIIKHHD